MLVDKETDIEKDKDIETPETDKDKPLEAEVDDIVIENEELFIVEAEDDESDKSKETDKEVDDPELEAAEKETDKSKEKVVDEPEIPDATKTEMTFLKRQVEEQNKLIEKMNLPAEELLKRTSLDELEEGFKKQKGILDDIDPDLSPKEFSIQKKVVEQLLTDIEFKKQSIRIDERFNAADNKEFLEKERKELEDRGFEYSDDNWQLIEKVAEKYLDGGKYTKEAVQKGLIDILGADAVNKMYEVSSEQKVRKDLKEAATKVTKSINITSKGVKGRLTSFTSRIAKMTEQSDIEEALSRLTPEQFAIYEKELERRKK